MVKKRILVTGSGRGIGAGIAKKFANNGDYVFLVARSEDELKRTKAEISTYEGQIEYFVGDLNQRNTAAELVNTIQELWNGIDVLVLNAGAAPQGSIFELSDDDWENGFRLKMFANMRVLRLLWPSLKEKTGSVVMIGGGTARMPDYRLPLVSAINGGLASLSKAIAEQGYMDNVQVNLIQPGTIETERREKLFEKFAKNESTTLSDYKNSLSQKLHIKRLGKPSDIANLAFFLTQEESRWIHGAIIDVDGGQNKSV